MRRLSLAAACGVFIILYIGIVRARVRARETDAL
jgi:hypothetical protein